MARDGEASMLSSVGVFSEEITLIPIGDTDLSPKLMLALVP